MLSLRHAEVTVSTKPTVPTIATSSSGAKLRPQVSQDFFSKIDAPRDHTDGCVTFLGSRHRRSELRNFERMPQRSIQCHPCTGPTTPPEVLGIVTKLTPHSLLQHHRAHPLRLRIRSRFQANMSYRRMSQKANNRYTAFNFADSTGGPASYQRVDVTGAVWFRGGGGVYLVLLRCTTSDTV